VDGQERLDAFGTVLPELEQGKVTTVGRVGRWREWQGIFQGLVIVLWREEIALKPTGSDEEAIALEKHLDSFDASLDAGVTLEEQRLQLAALCRRDVDELPATLPRIAQDSLRHRYLSLPVRRAVARLLGAVVKPVLWQCPALRGELVARSAIDGGTFEVKEREHLGGFESCGKVEPHGRVAKGFALSCDGPTISTGEVNAVEVEAGISAEKVLVTVLGAVETVPASRIRSMTRSATDLRASKVEREANTPVLVELAVEGFTLGQSVRKEEAQFESAVLLQSVIGEQGVDGRGELVRVLRAVLYPPLLETATGGRRVVEEGPHLLRAGGVDLAVQEAIKFSKLCVSE